MSRVSLVIVTITFCFSLLVSWFAWTTLRTAPTLAGENLRGAGLAIAAAIEQLAAADPSFRSLTRYTTPDIAYFALVDRHGTVRFHTNPGLVGMKYVGPAADSPMTGPSGTREYLGTGEEVYFLRAPVHIGPDQYQLELAMHTYRADAVIRRARAGVTIVAVGTLLLWGVAALLLGLLRRQERQMGELRRREELARLGEMGAVLAHEIRNPLAGIKGFAQLVEMTSSLEQARSHAFRIVGQAVRMEGLVDDLLAYVRDDRGERSRIDLSVPIEESVALVRDEASRQQVEVRVEIREPVQAMVATDRILQVLLNLLKNGLQAMPDGGVLTVGLCRQGGEACITVRDTGSGIAPEHLPHIFEPFWTSKSRGTGLGLALCRKVTEAHGGRLTVASSIGAGTVCTVVLPGG